TAGRGDFAKDGYNVFLNVEASRQDQIWQRDRMSREWIGNPDVRLWGYDLRLAQSGMPLNNLAGYILPDAAAPNLLGAVRNPASLQYVQLPGCVSSYPLSSGMGGCLWAPSDWIQILPGQKSLSGLGRGIVQLAPAFQAYVEAGTYEDNVKYAFFPVNI